jgi:hypothetical protein
MGGSFPRMIFSIAMFLIVSTATLGQAPPDTIAVAICTMDRNEEYRQLLQAAVQFGQKFGFQESDMTACYVKGEHSKIVKSGGSTRWVHDCKRWSLDSGVQNGVPALERRAGWITADTSF